MGYPIKEQKSMKSKMRRIKNGLAYSLIAVMLFACSPQKEKVDLKSYYFPIGEDKSITRYTYEDLTGHYVPIELAKLVNIMNGDTTVITKEKGSFLFPSIAYQEKIVKNGVELTHFELLDKSKSILSNILKNKTFSYDGSDAVWSVGLKDHVVDFVTTYQKFYGNYGTFEFKGKTVPTVMISEEVELKNKKNHETTTMTKKVNKHYAKGIGLVKIEVLGDKPRTYTLVSEK